MKRERERRSSTPPKLLKPTNEFDILLVQAARERILNRNFTVAREYVNKAIAMAPNDPRVYFEAILLSLHSKKHMDVLRCFNLLSLCQPTNQYWINVSKGLLEEKNGPQIALQYYREALQCTDATDGQFRAHLFMGNMLAEEEAHEESIYHYEMAYEIQLKLPVCCDYLLATCLYNISDTHRMLDDYRSAIAYVDKAITVCPEYIGLVLEKAEYYSSLGETDEAERLCQYVLSTAKDKFNISDAHSRLSVYSSTIDINHAQEAIKASPENAFAHKVLVAGAIQHSDYENVVRYAERALKYLSGKIEMAEMAKSLRLFGDVEVKNKYKNLESSFRKGLMDRIS